MYFYFGGGLGGIIATLLCLFGIIGVSLSVILFFCDSCKEKAKTLKEMIDE